MAHDAFVSYSSEDRQAAEILCGVLESSGIRCWVAPRDVLPGQDYAEAIVDAIDQCAVFVLLLSGRSNESPHVRREAERAASRGKRFIPLRIENIAPAKSIQYFIGSSHWLDALSPPYEPQFLKVAEAIRRHLGQPAAPARPAPIPQAPSRAGGGKWLAAAAVALCSAGAFFLVQQRRPKSDTSKTPVSAPAAKAPAAKGVELDGCGGEYPQELGRAKNYLAEGEGTRAARALERALRACPEGRSAKELVPAAGRKAFAEFAKAGQEEARWGRKDSAAGEYNYALSFWPDSSDAPEAVKLRAAIIALGGTLREWGGPNPDGCSKDYGKELAWGQSYLSQGNSYAAIRSFERAGALCPAGKTVGTLLPQAKKLEFENCKRKALAAEAKGEKYTAARHYRDAIKYWPGSPEDREAAAIQAKITRLEQRR